MLKPSPLVNFDAHIGTKYIIPAEQPFIVIRGRLEINVRTA